MTVSGVSKVFLPQAQDFGGPPRVIIVLLLVWGHLSANSLSVCLDLNDPEVTAV